MYRKIFTQMINYNYYEREDIQTRYKF